MPIYSTFSYWKSAKEKFYCETLVSSNQGRLTCFNMLLFSAKKSIIDQWQRHNKRF